MSKSFSHKVGNTRLTMMIWKFIPTVDGERPSFEKVHTVEWPIVDQSACFDPSMISII